jgi:hypothetical protein
MVNDHDSCEFIQYSIETSDLTSNFFLSGTIVSQVQIWTSIVITSILPGKLPSAVISLVLTWLHYHASHHDHSVIRHVLAIQKNPRLSYHSLPGSRHHNCSALRHHQWSGFWG